MKKSTDQGGKEGSNKKPEKKKNRLKIEKVHQAV